MFYFPCVTCGTPMPITDVHGWLGGNPVCSEPCATQARAAGRGEDPRSAPEVMRDTLALLLETGDLVRVSCDRAGRAESHLSTATGLSSTPAVLAFGVLPGAIAGMVHEASESAYAKDVFDIDDRLHRVVRSVMILESLGVPAAGHLQPIVQRYGSLSGMSASGMQGVLQQLWHHLKHAYDGLAAIQASSQGPFR
ncbi:MAG: hypothetical protein H6719_21140 [Sandaracinaceae bacterium]|nr:hypothetical protein [Sandaracinaceae bacterium]